MSTEENKATDRRAVEEGWNQGNTAVFDELLAANYSGHDPSGLIPTLSEPACFTSYSSIS